MESIQEHCMGASGFKHQVGQVPNFSCLCYVIYKMGLPKLGGGGLGTYRLKFFQIEGRKEEREGEREGGRKDRLYSFQKAMYSEISDMSSSVGSSMERSRSNTGTVCEHGEWGWGREILDAGTIVTRLPGLFEGSALTIVWNDAPGHGRCINAARHPEDAQPTEVFSPLLPGQEFRKIGKNNGQSTPNPAERKCQKESSHTLKMDSAETLVTLYLTLKLYGKVAQQIWKTGQGKASIR